MENKRNTQSNRYVIKATDSKKEIVKKAVDLIWREYPYTLNKLRNE